MIRDFWISINEKYQRNKAVIWFIIVIVVLFILVMRNIDKISNTARGSSESSTTSGSVYNEDKLMEIATNCEDNYEEIEQTIQEIDMNREDRIKLFIMLCNNGKIEGAYNFLSDDCKRDMYPTKEAFIKDYYSVIFKISKEFEITEVKNDTYRVRYINDSLSTGGQIEEGDGLVDYITYVEGGKINISSYIEAENSTITSIAPYFTVYIDNWQVYMDHITYNIRLKNNTKADIYINDIDNSNLYIKDMNENIYKIDASEMFDSDYLIYAGKERSFKLIFNINYTDTNKISEICFGNMKFVNKEYLDSTVEVKNPTTGEMEYAKVKTNYPEEYSWIVRFE